MPGHFTVRVASGGDKDQKVLCRDYGGMTKNEALTFIRGFGKLSVIRRLGSIYIIQPSR